MNIVNSTIAVGDGLNTFRVTQALINKFLENGQQAIEIHWYNGDLGSLFPAEKYGAVNILNSRPIEADISISYHEHVLGRSDTDRSMDFSAAMSTKYGLNLEGIVPELNTPFIPDIPDFDFVIAPYVLNNPSKNPGPAFYQSLVDALKEKYPNYSIGIVGKGSMPSDEDLLKVEYSIERFKDPEYIRINTTQYLTGVDYFWDKSLQEVAQLLKNTKRLFITPDSGLRWLNTFIKKESVELYTQPHCLISSHFRDYHDNLREEQKTPITLEQTMQFIQKALYSL